MHVADRTSVGLQTLSDTCPGGPPLVRNFLTDQGTPGEKGEKGDKGDKGDPGTSNIRSIQTNEAVACEANETLVSVFCPNGGAAEGAKCANAPTIGLCLKKP